MLSKDEARRQLLERREALLRRHSITVADEEAALGEREIDLLDTAGERTLANLLERLSEAELVQLQRIHRALDRIERGVWDECVVCHQKIPAARLAVLPEADRCAGCSNSH